MLFSAAADAALRGRARDRQRRAHPHPAARTRRGSPTRALALARRARSGRSRHRADQGRRRKKCWRWRGAPASCARTSSSCCAPTIPDYVYYLEVRGRGVFLRASPIDVSDIMREVLLDRMKTTVLTSATLTVGRLASSTCAAGWASGDADEIRLDSEFDYAQQAILYLPRKMPDPRSPQFAQAAASEIVEILKRTARPRVRAVHELRQPARSAHGSPRRSSSSRSSCRAPRRGRRCCGTSRRRRNAVLLATSSFWQGVDVVGRSAELRDHRQAAVRLARRSDHRGAHRGDQRAGRLARSAITRSRSRCSRSNRGSAGCCGIASTAACSPCSIRGCGPWATAAGSWHRCRRRR